MTRPATQAPGTERACSSPEWDSPPQLGAGEPDISPGPPLSDLPTNETADPPRLLDLFCCQGGAAMGYHRAGFSVTGVDIEPQPNYPFTFIQADAMTFPLEGFDAIHASPPCQIFTQMNGAHRARHALGRGRPVTDLLTPTLARFRGLPVLWVIENVIGAGRAVGGATLQLHGGMFGLKVHRPRVFWSNVLILAPSGPIVRQPVGVWGDRPQVKRRTRLNGDQTGKRSIMWQAQSVEEAREAMEMPWADWHGCKEAIPPAYTEHIGSQLLDHLAAVA